MKKLEIQNKIDSLFNSVSNPNFALKADEKSFLEKVINKIDSGELRAAEKINGTWQINEYVKKAILLYMRSTNPAQMSITCDAYFSDSITDVYYKSTNITNKIGHVDNAFGMKYFDKIPLKFAYYCDSNFKDLKSRIVPGAIVRIGSYIGKNCVIMPSFINIGAYIGSGTMVDSWSTIGSCAQIGKNCHISGGVGIGGVLEPATAMPVIIEDDVFIGARSEVAEGVIIEEGSVLSMGVYIGASTKIINRETGEVFYGKVPAYSVVVPGSVPSSNGVNIYAAIIVKTVDEKTRSKTSINELLRM